MTEHSPIFIIGSPRSGTTLLRLIVGAHPNIAIPPECGFAKWLQPSFESREWGKSADSLINEYCRAVHEARKFDCWNISYEQLTAYVLKHQPNTYACAVAAVYRCYSSLYKVNATRWGDKNNYYLSHIEDIHNLFPRANFVHIVRDPRDVVASRLEVAKSNYQSKYAPRFPLCVEQNAEIVRDDILAIQKSFNAMSKRGGITVKYEDLVSRSESTIKCLCAFLNETFSPAMLDYHLETRSVSLVPELLSEWKQKTFHPIDSSAVHKYKRVLTAGQVGVITSITAQSHSKYGYSDVGGNN